MTGSPSTSPQQSQATSADSNQTDPPDILGGFVFVVISILPIFLALYSGPELAVKANNMAENGLKHNLLEVASHYDEWMESQDATNKDFLNAVGRDSAVFAGSQDYLNRQIPVEEKNKVAPINAWNGNADNDNSPSQKPVLMWDDIDFLSPLTVSDNTLIEVRPVPGDSQEFCLLGQSALTDFDYKRGYYIGNVDYDEYMFYDSVLGKTVTSQELEEYSREKQGLACEGTLVFSIRESR